MEAVPMAPWKTIAASKASATLPDDIVLEILSRVADDIAALFRCTVACKAWRALVADYSFLHGRWSEDARHPSSLLGLFGRQQNSDGALISGLPTFVPAPRSPLVPSHRFPNCFGPCTVRLLDNADPLVSHQGLLLMHLYPRGETGDHLAVCDMFAGTCQRLPQPECAYFGIYGYAISADTDYCSKEGPSPLSSYSNGFKVLVIIDEFIAGRLYLTPYSFSSSESSWSTPKKPFDLIKRDGVNSNLVWCRGKVHRLVCDMSDICNLYTFEVGNGTIDVSLAKLSIPRDQLEFSCYNPPRLNATIDGKLSLFSLHTKCLKIEIWTHQSQKECGDGAADWLRTKVIELKPKMMQIGKVSYTCLGERSGTFIILDRHKLVYIVNLETGAIDQFPSKFCTFGRYNVVPFEIDWPAFFMSRLEAKHKEENESRCTASCRICK